MSGSKLPTSGQAAVDAFLAQVRAAPKPVPATHRGRLIFALDATLSRQPTWDQATQLQADMFRETQALGGLDLQLVYYRGFHDFYASPWLADSGALLRHMNGVDCQGGQTQIERVLAHAVDEAKARRVAALVFIGDAFEENADTACRKAGELGLLGVPVFVFHEGGGERPAQVFREIARLSKGAYCPFDAGSAKQLRELLSAVAVYAAGGRPALESHARKAGGAALLLTHRLG
ncbi:MAG: VWA domain-containing protein [Alphaproteobacteria bacterium]|nr:VWA domain-containing protein [Alphaproteobacteria bacterium]